MLCYFDFSFVKLQEEKERMYEENRLRGDFCISTFIIMFLCSYLFHCAS